MKVIIIEDETLVAKSLQKLLMQVDASIDVIGIYDSVKSSVAFFESTHAAPDLVFMDIQLSDGTCFDIFKKVSVQLPIIFTTAFNEYALRAFKMNSIDYLLKPIDNAELSKAIEKYKRISLYGKQFFEEQFKQLNAHYHEPKPYKERFIVHHGSAFVVMNTSDIVAFKKEQFIFAVNKKGEELMTDFETLDELEEILSPKEFYRANRQYIVNIAFVKQFKTDTYGKLNVWLSIPKEIQLDISREKASSFKKWLS
jgi:two-component system, LytTR family, response regulator